MGVPMISTKRSKKAKKHTNAKKHTKRRTVKRAVKTTLTTEVDMPVMAGQMGGAASCGVKQAGGSPASFSVMNTVNTPGMSVTLDQYQTEMDLPTIKTLSSCGQQVGGGGSSCMVAPNPTIGGGLDADGNKLNGGGLVDPVVVGAASQGMMLDDYKSQMGLPSVADLKGGCGCGKSTGRQRGGNNKHKQRGGATSTKNMKGGSPASSRLNNLTNQRDLSILNESKPTTIDGGAGANLNTYELSGGNSCNTKLKGGSPWAKTLKNKPLSSKMHGGGFWNLAGCGPVNAPDAGRKYAGYFSKTSTCPGPEFYANPPGLPKAGSGDIAELALGATYPFA